MTLKVRVPEANSLSIGSFGAGPGLWSDQHCYWYSQPYLQYRKGKLWLPATASGEIYQYKMKCQIVA